VLFLKNFFWKTKLVAHRLWILLVCICAKGYSQLFSVSIQYTQSLQDQPLSDMFLLLPNLQEKRHFQHRLTYCVMYTFPFVQTLSMLFLYTWTQLTLYRFLLLHLLHFSYSSNLLIVTIVTKNFIQCTKSLTSSPKSRVNGRNVRHFK